METLSDNDLLAAVIDEKPGAWRAFFDRHQRLMIACLRRVYHRYHVPLAPHELEDLIASVCLELVKNDYRKLRLYDPDRGYRISSWVGLIATNLAHDALRRRGPPLRSTDEEDGPLQELSSADPSPLEIVDLKEKTALLIKAIEQLTSTDQEFVRLYYIDRLSPEEIAESTGVSVNTIYSRKNKVRAKLARLVRTMTRVDQLREL